MSHTLGSGHWLALQSLREQSQSSQISEQQRKACFLPMTHKSTNENTNSQTVISSLFAGGGKAQGNFGKVI